MDVHQLYICFKINIYELLWLILYWENESMHDILINFQNKQVCKSIILKRKKN